MTCSSMSTDAKDGGAITSAGNICEAAPAAWTAKLQSLAQTVTQGQHCDHSTLSVVWRRSNHLGSDTMALRQSESSRAQIHSLIKRTGVDFLPIDQETQLQVYKTPAIQPSLFISLICMVVPLQNGRLQNGKALYALADYLMSTVWQADVFNVKEILPSVACCFAREHRAEILHICPTEISWNSASYPLALEVVIPASKSSD